ncbi:glutamic acid-rich protein-like [Hydractinia symbiolongicarpus]|uniref:glutamic acid-rich protein-like n=1 Tax=Hydractinia symbiolongicarpus TaxID=13093 RepID=UPI00254B3DD4|nr:glutamic acid-rich protein-like [Hydractinia symbiolongicarpus]
MTYYAHAKGGIPFHKREEERRWKEHLKHHKRTLDRSKPSITSLDRKVEHQHVQIKLKKLQLQEDRLSTIEYQNRKLREKIDRIENRKKKETWNDIYTPREKSGNLPSLYVRDSSMGESNAATSNNEESSEDADNGDDEAMSSENSSEEVDSTRENDEPNEEEENEDDGDDEDDEGKKEEEEKESQSRNSNAQENTVPDNPHIKKRLRHLEFTVVKSPDEKQSERKRLIEEEREALKKEAESLRQRNQYRRRFIPIGNEERVMENKRLHRKIREIKEGRGRPQPDAPEYNTHDRWWVTSPRGHERAVYEKEKERLLKDMKKHRERRKTQKAREERKILKQKEKEEKQKQEAIPQGYHKKKRKKAKHYEKQPEELPDTSIVTNDPYERAEEFHSDG